MLFLVVLTLVAPLFLILGWIYWAHSETDKKEHRIRITASAPEPEAPPAERVFRVATYNMGYASGQANNLRLLPVTETQANLSRIHEFLEKSNLDFIALQEVDYDCRRSGCLNQADLLKTGLFQFSAEAVNWNKNYVPFPVWPPQQHFGRILAGQATLSRYPIEKAQCSIFEKPKENTFLWNAFYLDRLALISRIRVGKEILTLVNLHLEAFVQASRERQAKALRKLLESFNSEPLIVTGDFNTAGNITGTEATLSILTDGDFLRHASSKIEPTFPSWQPALTLDHFLVNSRIQVVRCETVDVPQNPSDHHPVILDFRMIKH